MTQEGQMLEEAKYYESSRKGNKEDGEEIVAQSLLCQFGSPVDENASQSIPPSEEAEEETKQNG